MATSVPVYGVAFAAGLLVGLLGLAAFWLLQKWSWGPDKSVAQANQWRMVPPPPGLQEPIDSLAPDLMRSEPTTTKQPSPSTMPPAPAVDTKDNEDKTTKAGVVPEGAAKPASAPTSTEAEGSAAKESGPEIPDGNLKKWVGQQLEPIRATQRDIVKSLSELLDGQGSTTETNGKLMEKLDKLQMAVDRSLELHKAEAPVQIAEKMGKFQATIDQSIELHKTAAKTADKLSKDLHELTDISGRRHAATEVATEGTQEQLRGLKRELEATYTSLRDHRTQLKEHVTESGKRRMDILQEIAQMNTKVHNGFAGLSAMTRSHASTVTETKENTERTLEIAEKTLAAVRVSGPSPSEAELLEAVGDTQKSLKDIQSAMGTLESQLESLKTLVNTPTPATPPPIHAPGNVPAAASHPVPPPPQHAPNLINLTPAGNSGHGGGWGTNGPTAAVMLGHPQQILRMMAGHAGDGSS